MRIVTPLSTLAQTTYSLVPKQINLPVVNGNLIITPLQGVTLITVPTINNSSPPININLTINTQSFNVPGDQLIIQFTTLINAGIEPNVILHLPNNVFYLGCGEIQTQAYIYYYTSFSLIYDGTQWLNTFDIC